MADLSQAVAWHRQVAALAAAADRAGVATADLPAVRARLLTQQWHLADAAARTGAPPPDLNPSPSEIASAGPALGDLTDPAIAQSVRGMYSTLDAVDAALGIPAPAPIPAMAGPAQVPVAPPPNPPVASPPPTPDGTAVVDRVNTRPALRNGLIYGGFAFVVFVVQLGLFVLLTEQTLPLFAPLCLVILPAFAWLAGYLTISVLFRGPKGSPPTNRTPRLGAIVCLIPDLLLLCGVGALFMANLAS